MKFRLALIVILAFAIAAIIALIPQPQPPDPCVPIYMTSPGAVVAPDGTAYPYHYSIPGSCYGK